MPKPVLTREFSICLIPSEDITSDLDTLRDDVPHSTLLRGISAKNDLSDDTLLQKIDSILAISKELPFVKFCSPVVV
jgi:hypothetical protein